MGQVNDTQPPRCQAYTITNVDMAIIRPAMAQQVIKLLHFCLRGIGGEETDDAAHERSG
jgi:hypothetical protein